MREYHVNFKKVGGDDVHEVNAEISEDDPELIEAAEAIRSEIVARTRDLPGGLKSIPNGHFMEIEFLVDADSAHGVVFLTPWLPARFADVLREVLNDAGIDQVLIS